MLELSGWGFWCQAGPRGYQPAQTSVCRYSLFWHHYLGPLASSVPQVTVPDILHSHLRHNPSVPTDLSNLLVTCSWYFYYCKNPMIHTCIQIIHGNAVSLYKHVQCQDVSFGVKQGLGVINRPERPYAGTPYFGTTILALSPQVYLKLLYSTYYVRISVITRRSLQTCLTYLSCVLDISTFARSQGYIHVLK